MRVLSAAQGGRGFAAHLPASLHGPGHGERRRVGYPLFTRRGRRLVLTESGRVAYQYAEEIFGLGRELQDTLRDRPVGRPMRLSVGVADVVPKLIAQRALESAQAVGEPVRWSAGRTSLSVSSRNLPCITWT